MRPTQRLISQHGGLLVVDLQDKLLDLIPDRDAVVSRTAALIGGAQALGMPIWGTEQYPRGLGPTTARIAELVPERPAKTMFHCCAVPQIVEELRAKNIQHVTVAGIEAHVCIAQTALELLDLGFRVQVPADAVASRHKIDWEFGLRRLEHVGVVVSTTESALFEWTERSDRTEFKTISSIVKSLA